MNYELFRKLGKKLDLIFNKLIYINEIKIEIIQNWFIKLNFYEICAFAGVKNISRMKL